MGETGCGVAEYWGVDPDDIDIMMGTFALVSVLLRCCRLCKTCWKRWKEGGREQQFDLATSSSFSKIKYTFGLQSSSWPSLPGTRNRIIVSEC